VIVVVGAWQYSHHLLAGLRTHQGPILLVANWSGQFPGLVGMLNLTGSLTKAGIAHSTLWSEDFTDEWAREGLRTWLTTGTLVHDTSHVRDVTGVAALGDGPEVELGSALARQLVHEKAVLGVFDEGCMGMYNAIFDDELLNPMGLYKERLSQSALVVEMGRVSDEEARPSDVAGRRRHDVPHRYRRGERAHRRAAAEPVPDVRRGAPDGRRLRARRGRHPVPAGAQGRRAGERPR
jgi:hypothetical protein